MCQLCTIKDLASRERWPKPVEPLKVDIDFLVTSAHEEYAVCKSNTKASKGVTASKSLVELLRLLAALFDSVDEEREKWWTSPAKRDLRKRLEDSCEQRKLSDLHLINNAVVNATEAMNAKLGTFVKWTLGFKGGVEGLHDALDDDEHVGDGGRSKDIGEDEVTEGYEYTSDDDNAGDADEDASSDEDQSTSSPSKDLVDLFAPLYDVGVRVSWRDAMSHRLAYFLWNDTLDCLE